MPPPPEAAQAPQKVAEAAGAPPPVPSNGAGASTAAPASEAPVSKAPALSPEGTPLTLGMSWEELLREAPPPFAPPLPTQQLHEVQGKERSEQPSEDATPEESAAADAPSEPAAEEAQEPSPEGQQAAPEPSEPALDEASLIERLTAEKRGLLRIKGRDAQEKGELRQRVSQLETELRNLQERATVPVAEAAEPLPPPEELVGKLLENPAEVIRKLAKPGLTRDEVREMLVEEARAWTEQQAKEQAEVAPLVAKDLFMQRHSLKGDFDAWLGTPEGAAVSAIVEKDVVRSRALKGFVEDGDVVGITDVLTKAYEAHQLGQRAAKARHAVNGEKTRIEASKPSTPIKSAPAPSRLPQEKHLYDKWDETDLIRFLQGAQPYEPER